MKSSSIYQTTFRLNLDKNSEREAMTYLQKAKDNGKSINDYLISCILKANAQTMSEDTNNELLESIRTIIKEELSNAENEKQSKTDNSTITDILSESDSSLSDGEMDFLDNLGIE